MGRLGSMSLVPTVRIWLRINLSPGDAQRSGGSSRHASGPKLDSLRHGCRSSLAFWREPGHAAPEDFVSPARRLEGLSVESPGCHYRCPTNPVPPLGAGSIQRRASVLWALVRRFEVGWNPMKRASTPVGAGVEATWASVSVPALAGPPLVGRRTLRWSGGPFCAEVPPPRERAGAWPL
jgi:hypothetical protein